MNIRRKDNPAITTTVQDMQVAVFGRRYWWRHNAEVLNHSLFSTDEWEPVPDPPAPSWEDVTAQCELTTAVERLSTNRYIRVQVPSDGIYRVLQETRFTGGGSNGIVRLKIERQVKE